LNADRSSSDSAPTATQAPKSKPEFLSLAETLSSLIALIQDGKLVYVNPAASALLGYPKDHFVGRPFWEFVHPDDREVALARNQARNAGIPQPKRLMERLIHQNGEAVWMDYSVDVIDFEGRRTTLVTGHDITQRRRMEEELRWSEARLAEAQRIAHIGSWEWDVATNRLTWSDELRRIYGVDPRQFGGTIEGYLELVHPEDREMARRVISDALRSGEPFAFEHRVVRPDGSVRTAFGRGEVFRDESGRPVRIAGSGQDITERKRIEEELRRSEERFRLTFTHAAIGKAIVSPDRRILQVNPAVCRMLGYGESELLALRAEDVTHPDDVAKTDVFVRLLLEGPHVSGALEERFLHKDGRTVWGRLTATLVRGSNGEPLYFIGEIEDISERKKAEEALRESEERFRSIVTQAPVMLMAFYQDGRVRDVSHYWLQTMGYERSEVVESDGWSLLTPDSQERLQRAIEECQRNHQSVIKNLPLTLRRKDGSTVEVLSTSVAELCDRGETKGAICVQVDLTDLQRAEAALRESEERYRALVEHAPEAIMVLDVDTNRFVDANEPAEKLFGYTREQLLRMGPLDFCSQHQADGRESGQIVECEHRKVLEGETAVFEFTHVDASGREVVCQTHLSRLPAAGRRLIRTTVTDISELKQLQEKVRHSEKLAAVGVLAAGVAHEIGNPLMALSMAAQSLERRACDDYTQKKLTLIREHIERISRIVRQMSDLAQPRSGQRGPCDLNHVVRRAVDMVRYDKRANGAEVVYELSEALPEIAAVEDELTQVCINLALNAFDAMGANPPERPRRLTVRSSVVGTPARGDTPRAERIRVEFSDTGPGVPSDVRPKLFQPFFTTKEAGRGSGLGLSVSYRILREHDGVLKLEDHGAPGALFAFELPVGRG
jgi:two-component system, cell cycle sensor histidine kinase and response regulator CckA